ncbi:MAG: hypothetical protein L6Q83_14125, partial [Gammaproteobacteria bacterium]|nr:hypothetical protein [Gammaproteobacteria bacterium]
LHTLAAEASGLAAVRSRPLPDADNRVFAGAERNLLVVTRASTLRPQLLRISSSESWVAPGAAKVDPDVIRGRLRLTVNELGEIRPVE